MTPEKVNVKARAIRDGAGSWQTESPGRMKVSQHCPKVLTHNGTELLR